MQEAEANSHPTSVVCLADRLGSRESESLKSDLCRLQRGTALEQHKNIRHCFTFLCTGLRDKVNSR